MLGQDFWLSPISRASPSPSSSWGLLHKSTSEPINIQHPFAHQRKASQDSNSSRSESDFSNFMHPPSDVNDSPRRLHKPSARPRRNKPKFAIAHASSHSYVPHSSSSSAAEPKDSSLSVAKHSNPTHDDYSSPSHRLSRVEMSASHDSWVTATSPSTMQRERSHPVTKDTGDIYSSSPCNVPAAKHSVDDQQNNNIERRSTNHPHAQSASSSKNKSSLYFTTNIGLMQASESNYFRSSLSDKLSDYEDIWINSTSDDPRTVLEFKSKGNRDSVVFENAEKVDKVVQAEKSPGKVIKQSTIVSTASKSREGVVQTSAVGMTALEQARMIAMSASEDESATPVAHVKGIQRMESVFDEDIATATTTTTTSTITTQTQNSHFLPARFVSEKFIGSIEVPSGANQEIKFVTSHSVAIGKADAQSARPLSPPCVSGEPSSSTPQTCDSSAAQLSKCVFTTTMSVIMSDGNIAEQSMTHQSVQGQVVSSVDHNQGRSLTDNRNEARSNSFSNPSQTPPKPKRKALSPRPIASPRLSLSPRPSLSPKPVISPNKPRSKSSPTKSNVQISVEHLYNNNNNSLNSLPEQSVALSKKDSLKPPALALSRLKSSSESSIATVSSPLYAEPVDAVQLRDKEGKTINVHVRRRSAPINPTKAARAKSKISANPHLETIVSPDPQDPPNKFTFDTPKVVLRSTSLRTPQPGKEVHRKHSWRERLSRLKLGTKALTQRFSPGYDSKRSPPDPLTLTLDQSYEEGDALTEPNTPSHVSLYPTKFPVNHGEARMSGFSESSTFQDMISCAHPELSMRPIPVKHSVSLRHRGPPSEYDNLHVYNRHSTHSSNGTVYSPPWESKVAQLIHDPPSFPPPSFPPPSSPPPSSPSPTLPPAMDAQERVQRWQEANSTYQEGRGGEGVPSTPESSRRIEECVSPPKTPRKSPSLTPLKAQHLDENKNIKPGLERLSSQCPDVVHCHSKAQHSKPTQPEPSGYRTPDPIAKDNHLTNLTDSKTPGAKIKEYLVRLSTDTNTTFGMTIENFIQCTLESNETSPQKVMRNVRQFMNGIKNYLMKHGEGELEGLIENERTKLRKNEILNVDSVLEQALHVCVLRPVKHHLYRLFVDTYSRSGALLQLADNIRLARTKSPQEIGVKSGLQLPSGPDMERIKGQLELMQKSYSPLSKLEHLLQATATIYRCVQGKVTQVPTRGPASLGADDFLPVLIYTIIHCGLVACEVEADFMWGLLQPSLLTGEGGYYLTTLSSAVLVLKNFKTSLQPHTMERPLPSLSDMQGFLKVAIPDEVHGSIVWKTLPVRPNMNTRDVCTLVAHKLKVTNPQDHGLFLLCDGVESQLAETDCPQVVKGEGIQGTDVYFAFRRLDANIAWPRATERDEI